MKNDLEIKPLAVCLESIPELARLLYEEIGRHWVPDASIEKAKQNLIKHANTDKMPLTLVAFLECNPIGMASLRENDGIQPKLTPWLGSLVVHPNYRRQKVGEALIEAVNDQARMLCFKRIYLFAFDQTIPSWYAKLGWRVIGKDTLFNHVVTVMDYSLESSGIDG